MTRFLLLETSSPARYKVLNHNNVVNDRLVLNKEGFFFLIAYKNQACLRLRTFIVCITYSVPDML